MCNEIRSLKVLLIVVVSFSVCLSYFSLHSPLPPLHLLHCPSLSAADCISCSLITPTPPPACADSSSRMPPQSIARAPPFPILARRSFLPPVKREHTPSRAAPLSSVFHYPPTSSLSPHSIFKRIKRGEKRRGERRDIFIYKSDRMRLCAVFSCP